jgi:prepilin-type N-terminal cleavage/methylation domain-containing protein
MRASRFGFTVLELITVLAIMGILSVLAMPKFAETVRHTKVRSARNEIVAYFTRARAVAISRGQRTDVRVAGTRMAVVTIANGVEQTVVQGDLYEQHGVTLYASQGQFSYDPRGFTANMAGAGRLMVTRDDWTLPVCVSRLGKAYINGCQ